MLPCANTEAMKLHLAEISRQAAPGAHAVITLDGAGWHQTAGKLQVPSNISLLALPPPDRVRGRLYSPELNPHGNIWQYLRQNHFANRVFETCDAILTACCDAWNALTAQPDKITSIATRWWAEQLSNQGGWYNPLISLWLSWYFFINHGVDGRQARV